MKKFLSFMVMGLVGILPLTVNAESEIVYSCDAANAEGVKTCTVGYNIDAASPQDNITVTLTENGGAEITAINGVAGADFAISTQGESNGVWSVVLASPDAVAGEQSLFTFTYRESGLEDCSVLISIGNNTTQTTPSTTPDEPTDNVQTGSTLPYIALGAIALVAVGAYVVTKNKSKMYKI